MEDCFFTFETQNNEDLACLVLKCFCFKSSLIKQAQLVFVVICCPEINFCLEETGVCVFQCLFFLLHTAINHLSSGCNHDSNPEGMFLCSNMLKCQQMAKQSMSHGALDRCLPLLFLQRSHLVHVVSSLLFSLKVQNN